MTDPSMWRTPRQPVFRNDAQKISALRQERIRARLKNIIAARKVTELGLKGVARRLRLSTQQLRYRFPHEAEKIIKLGFQKRKAAASLRAREREERMSKAIRIVLGKHKSPSERQLKATGLVKPSDLRRKSRK